MRDITVHMCLQTPSVSGKLFCANGQCVSLLHVFGRWLLQWLHEKLCS